MSNKKIWHITEENIGSSLKWERISNIDLEPEKCQNLQIICDLSPWSTKNWETSLSNRKVIVSAVIKTLNPTDWELIALCLTQTILNESELLQIFVSPSYQNKGIAKFLIKNQLSWLKKNQYRKMTLEVNKYNNRAISFYKNIGFYQYSVREKYYRDMHGNYSNALLMSIEF